MTHLPDALTASSLLMAILAILFSTWSGDLGKTLAQPFPLAQENRTALRREIAFALFAKAAPLSLAAWAAVAVFAPRALAILATAIPDKAPRELDDVAAAFAISELLVLAIAISATVQVAQLAAKWRGSYST